MDIKPLSLEELQAANARIHLMTQDELTEFKERLYASVPPDAREAMARMDAILERPRAKLTALTQDALRGLPDDDLEYAIYEYVSQHINSYEDNPAALLQLPRGLQICYLSFILEVEVMNGGVNQFFWNPSSKMAVYLPAALNELGSPEASRIFEDVLRVAKEEAEIRPIPDDFTMEVFMASYKETELCKFDDELCSHIERFPELRRQYLRNHEDLFLQQEV